MNVFLDWVISQGTGSPPSYRGERMSYSPWLPTKEAVIKWIEDHERNRATPASISVPVIHPSDFPGDAS